MQEDNRSTDTLWPLPVGIRKFVLMSFFTIGLYDVYWFYWNWRRQARRTQETIHAGWRAFLSPFVAYLLLRDVRNLTRANWSAGILALAYFVMLMGAGLPGWSWCLTFLAFLPLIPVQRSINELHAASPGGETADNTLTPLNIIGIVFGALMIVMIVTLGIMMDHGAFKDLQLDAGSLLQ